MGGGGGALATGLKTRGEEGAEMLKGVKSKFLILLNHQEKRNLGGLQELEESRQRDGSTDERSRKRNHVRGNGGRGEKTGSPGSQAW